MAKGRGKQRRRPARELAAEATNRQVAAGAERATAAATKVEPPSVLSSSQPPVATSYIRELRPTAEPAASAETPAARVAAPAPVREQTAVPAPSEPPTAPAADDDGALDEFERRLISGRRTSSAAPLGPRARRGVLAAAIAAGALAVVGWFAHGRAARPHAVATVHAATHAVATPAPAPAPTPPPVAAAPAEEPAAAVAPPAAEPAPAPAVANESAASVLESEAVPAQPTAALTELLRAAIHARSRGERAAVDALQAWLDAGGTDAQPVAQFAYWLGRRNSLRVAEQWAERATTMDPTSQMAWYVLGATRLEDPHQSRASAFEALRRCAAIVGRFTPECAGPLANPAAVRGPAPRATMAPRASATPRASTAPRATPAAESAPPSAASAPAPAVDSAPAAAAPAPAAAPAAPVAAPAAPSAEPAPAAAPSSQQEPPAAP